MKDVIVIVWRYRSETSYTFGPFTEAQAEAFAAKVDQNPDAEVSDFVLVNKPSLFGTGAELS